MATPPPRRVLVVEDDPTINQALTDRLLALGYAVERASDGPGAVATFERTEPDIVLLDLMLPGFDGLEVMRRIQPIRPTPVLMVTARDEEADIVLGLGVGADDYLTKPFRMREVVARIEALLRRVDRARELAATSTPATATARPVATTQNPQPVMSSLSARCNSPRCSRFPRFKKGASGRNPGRPPL